MRRRARFRPGAGLASLLLGLLLALGVSTALAAPRILHDCAQCPAMVVVEPGRFMMGSSREEPRRFGIDDYWGAREQPRHAVTISRAFAAGRTEVTRAQFAAFVADAGYLPAKGCWHFVGSGWEFDEKRSWRDPGFPQTDDHPVVCISWHDAQAYSAWLSARTMRHYRLLTEAEWEYAARAGSSSAYWFGDVPDGVCRNVNLGDLDTTERSDWLGKTFNAALMPPWVGVPCRDGYAFTAPVASFPANPFGLYDMNGNANEWVEDCWNDTYANGPADERPRLASGDCGLRVMRGQGWVGMASSTRSAFRLKMSAVDRRFAFGIRVARDLDPSEIQRGGAMRRAPSPAHGAHARKSIGLRHQEEGPSR
jgi:formylglycine-generating enzyme required for sulfatase activity